MDSLMMDQQAEWFILVPLIFHPINTHICNKIRDVPLFANGIIIHIYKIRVVVITLAGNNFPMIKSGWKTYQVPFSDKSGLIAVFPQYLRKSLLSTVKDTGTVVIKLIATTVLACQHTGTAGSTEGIRHKTVGKLYTIGCDTIQIGSMYITTVITAHHLSGVVVGHDIHNIIRFGILFLLMLARYK